MTVLSMSHRELSRFDTLQRVERRELGADDAAVLLGVSRRQVFRMLATVRERGVEGLVSGKRGRPSNNRLSPALAMEAIALVREHYSDFGPTFATEKLAEQHGIQISHETLRKLMIEAGLWRTRHARRRRVYQPRYRRDCVGELIQIDGSQHWWLEDRGPKTTLLVFIDDATSRLMHLKMEPSESAFAYMTAVREYIELHGKPVAFYSDKHSVFRNNVASAQGDGMTHFGRALDSLNIEIICANSAPAKGRVERVHQTLQDRLVKEMRLAGTTTVEAANAFFPAFIEQHNTRFAKAPFNDKDLHRPLAAHDDVGLAMTWREERTLTAALTLHYNKVMFMLEPTDAARKLARKRVMIFEYPDGRLEIRHGDEVLPYSVFDKMRRVNQAAIVDNKQLGAALEVARLMQEAAPHHRKRNKDAPKRRSQSGNLFEVVPPAVNKSDTGEIDGRTLGRPKLKRGPRLSNDDLIARGLGQYARQPNGCAPGWNSSPQAPPTRPPPPAL